MTDINQQTDESRVPCRSEGEPIGDWRKRRQAAAEALIGGMRPADDGLAARVDELADRIDRLADMTERTLNEMEGEINVRMDQLVNELREPPAARMVELEGGRRFAFADRDMLALSLAMFVAFRTGSAVDVPLSDGTLAEGLRAGELAEIARQLLEGG